MENRGLEYYIREAEKATPFTSIIDPDHPSFLAPGDMPSRIKGILRRDREARAEDTRRVREPCSEIAGRLGAVGRAYRENRGVYPRDRRGRPERPPVPDDRRLHKGSRYCEAC